MILMVTTTTKMDSRRVGRVGGRGRGKGWGSHLAGRTSGRGAVAGVMGLELIRGVGGGDRHRRGSGEKATVIAQ